VVVNKTLIFRESMHCKLQRKL